MAKIKTQYNGLLIVDDEVDKDEMLGEFLDEPLEKHPMADLHWSIEIPIIVAEVFTNLF